MLIELVSVDRQKASPNYTDSADQERLAKAIEKQKSLVVAVEQKNSV